MKLKSLRSIVITMLGTLVVVYLLAVSLGFIPSGSRLDLPDAILLVALLAGLTFGDSLSEFTLGSTGITFKFRELEKRTTDVERELNKLTAQVTKLFMNTMAPSMYNNLAKLRDRAGGGFDFTHSLIRELTHLRDAGYVEDFSPEYVREMWHCEVLADHIKITPLGLEFLALRESLDAGPGESLP
jgi:hypothetical protein